MESLFKRHDAYISRVPMKYIRDFMQRVNWDSRLIIIRGPKGVGKSTMMQQYIKKNFAAGDRHVLYCSADTNYFAAHSLLDLADNFVKIGGRWLFIDEVHKYPGWTTAKPPRPTTIPSAASTPSSPSPSAARSEKPHRKTTSRMYSTSIAKGKIKRGACLFFTF